MVTFEPEPVREKKTSPRTSIYMVTLALAAGIASVVCYLVSVPMAATVFGAIGLLFGGFCFGRAFTAPGKLRNILTGMVAATLLLSVVGFMLGFSGLLG